MWRRFAHLSTVVSRTKLRSSDPTVLKLMNPFSSDASLYAVELIERELDDPKLVTAAYHEMLTPLFGSKEEAVSSIVYSCDRRFSCFAAKLTESQAQILSEMPDVACVMHNRKYRIPTVMENRILGVTDSDTRSDAKNPDMKKTKGSTGLEDEDL